MEEINAKKSDSEILQLRKTLESVTVLFHKIIQVNLTEDRYQIIKLAQRETGEEYGFAEQFSRWFENFARNGLIHEEDLEDYLTFIRPDSLREHFKNSKKGISCRYRRKIDGKFRWVMMELLPSGEYSDDNQVVMLYVQDIHEDYISELRQRKLLEHYCNYDMITELYNRYHYYNKYSGYCCQDRPTGVVFADLNSLKYINDHFGHEEGDRYIRDFASLLAAEFGKEFCYRISGDEFVVVLEEAEEKAFLECVERFSVRLQQEECPMASVGYVWSREPISLTELVRKAEIQMYENKRELYRHHPEMDRRQTRQSEKREDLWK